MENKIFQRRKLFIAFLFFVRLLGILFFREEILDKLLEIRAKRLAFFQDGIPLVFRQFTQNRLVFRLDFGRHFDNHLDQKIAGEVASRYRHSAAFKTNNFAVLRSGGNFDLLDSVKGRNLNFSAQGRLRVTDGNLAN